MGTVGPWRTPFGPAQRASAHDPPPGSSKPIIKGLFRLSTLICEGIDQTHVDPRPAPQGFSPLGQALANSTSAGATTRGSIASDRAGIRILATQPWCLSVPLKGGSPATLPVSRILRASKPFATVMAEPLGLRRCGFQLEGPLQDLAQPVPVDYPRRRADVPRPKTPPRPVGGNQRIGPRVGGRSRATDPKRERVRAAGPSERLGWRLRLRRLHGGHSPVSQLGIKHQPHCQTKPPKK